MRKPLVVTMLSLAVISSNVFADDESEYNELSCEELTPEQYESSDLFCDESELKEEENVDDSEIEKTEPSTK